ncbi:MAG TPA: hypothetical protein VF226_10895 [Hyphomicrobiaceae bacterium]
MPKRTILRLIRGGKAVEGPAQSNRSPSQTSPEQESLEHCRARLADLNDPALKSLLDDYDIAVDSLRRWQMSHHPHAAERVLEYRTLISEIEVEILAVLDKRTT